MLESRNSWFIFYPLDQPVIPDFRNVNHSGPIGSAAVKRPPDGLVEAVLVSQIVPETRLAVASYNAEAISGWKNADFYSGRMPEPGKRELHQYLMDISSLNLQVAENPR